ncbi:MAG: hypothetical protein LHW56_01525 [Candidatus Cloacimonetes bacterium]|nr:hypothetical protein [Candidatus Cloacimonadota bacterium]MDY0171567.1 hypothetical protein [Candidatus Cloacimonadaceae bacterium]
MYSCSAFLSEQPSLREAFEKIGEALYQRRAFTKDAQKALQAIEYLEREGVKL